MEYAINNATSVPILPKAVDSFTDSSSNFTGDSVSGPIVPTLASRWQEVDVDSDIPESSSDELGMSSDDDVDLDLEWDSESEEDGLTAEEELGEGFEQEADSAGKHILKNA